MVDSGRSASRHPRASDSTERIASSMMRMLVELDNAMVEKQDPKSRRMFFETAARKLVGPVANYLEKRVEGVAMPPAGRILDHLRPPGALAEDQFIDTCQHSGQCIDVCPANAIFALAPAYGATARTPAINPDIAACVVCDGLLCTHACPSGALQPLTAPHQIDMGVAEVYASACVRSNDEDCTLCVEHCPIGAEAILFVDDGPPRVRAEGCTGCGVCQLFCPTTPKAIVIRPK